jgi:hypothetical protein
MSTPTLSRELAQQAVNMVAACNGNQAAAAKKYKVPGGTLQHRVEAAKRMGLTPNNDPIEDPTSADYLKQRVKALEGELANAQKKSLSETEIRRTIISLADDVAKTTTPDWVLDVSSPGSSPGVPTLFLSDFHWGEVVHPSQINGVNKFNLEIARKRLKLATERAVRLLSIISPKMDYPGIVVPLGGDMVSGNIHDELTASNEINTMPTVVDLFGELVALITTMADTFGKVFLPCVTGNHGRDTVKIWNKDRHHTSFDWLLYVFLAKRFEGDKRVTFLIPDGPDAYFRIFNHRYLLTHGDQFRGGDGMIGALGPIIRGDHKKRSRNAQIDMEYDTMLCGHWHQLIHLSRLIVNGSLKGYDEYAYNNNFGFEVPQQALWLTHPKYGITYRSPVFVDRVRAAAKTTWISVPQ